MVVRATVVIPRHVRDAATNAAEIPTNDQTTTRPDDRHRREPCVQRRQELAAYAFVASADRSFGNCFHWLMQEQSLPPRDSHLPDDSARQGGTCQTNKHSRLIVLGVVHQPRLLFQGWKPKLVDSPARVARRALERFLSSQSFQPARHDPRVLEAIKGQGGGTGTGSSTGRIFDDSASHMDPAEISDRVYRRTLRLFRRRSQSKHSLDQEPRSISLTIWLQPDHDSTLLEKSWESRLIQWENQLIKAQTAAGFLSTLGGAYFMCHHLTSACVLAQQQRRLALVLNDPSMYYKCCINQAYNLIYGGRFRFAHRLLRQVGKRVRDHAAHELGEDSRTVILNMCQSAKQFGKRVERAAAVLETANLTLKQRSQLTVDDSMASTGDASPEELLPSNTASAIGSHAPKSKVVDDLARIRVYQDESRWQDMVLPFQRLSS
jgi:Domain of unknown function (DUF4807)